MNFTQLLEHLLRVSKLTDVFSVMWEYLNHSGDPVMIVSQLVLIAFVLWVLFRYNTPNSKRPREVRPADFSDRFAQFMTYRKPLAPKSRQITQDRYTIVKHGSLNDSTPSDNPVVTRVKDAAGDVVDLTDFSTTDFLRLSRSVGSRQAAETTIASYGVGSCGPRGFYGTITPHMDLENHIGEVMRGLYNELIALCGKKWAPTSAESHAAIAYSFGYATVSSVISAFVKHQDYVVYDEAAPSSIQTGVNLSKSAHACAYAHNVPTGGHSSGRVASSVESAIERLEGAAALQTRDKQIRRKFIVIEGISAQRGTLVDLPAVLAVARKHHWRVLIDDSFAIGVLGAKGRGTIEHYADQGLLSDPAMVEFIRDYVMVTFTFSNALGSIGGACFGTKESAEFQTLNGLGYIFSASAPPYLCTVASHSLRTITDESEADLATLRENAVYLQDKLVNAGLPVVSSRISPMKIIKMAHPDGELPEGLRRADQRAISKFDDVQAKYANVCRVLRAENGFLVDRPAFSELDVLPSPIQASLRVSVSNKHSHNDIDRMVRVLRTALVSEFQG
ncbi:Aminotransferase class I and II [Carpediemonas membranifera]|uniref:serine C-palmitoyltransferase n=1 Tax=Carpediemonas membranifera TaxID=201153 RepID=A0A8J6AYE1_9EUKA|nr:Aminotransferase class I and II [Carpediemonas membranifera]|eukprot:KAG9391458.1 Aminotransferase class I and II [Carpediemonas membranifera]